MNKYAIVLSIGLAALSLVGCGRLEKELEDLKTAQESQNTQIAGLKVSDTPFSLSLMLPPSDTLTKGNEVRVVFRVNPSGVPLTQDMISLDGITSTDFFRHEEDTKASYVKASDYFSIASFAPDKNAAGEELEGQYVVGLKAVGKEAVWSDSRLALVGAYQDKEGKVQMVSSSSFSVVMMPKNEEGLDPWYYPNATLYVEGKLGTVYMALDRREFITKDQSDRRVYTCAFLHDALFTPDEGYPPLKAEIDKAHQCVTFVPDTTENEIWRAFKKVTEMHHQDVKGTLTLQDRWGGSCAYPISMAWYNTLEFQHDLSIKVSEIDAETHEYHADMTELFRKAGFDQSLISNKIRCMPSDVYNLNMDSDFSYEAMFPKDSRVMEITFYGDIKAGNEKTQDFAFTLPVNPSDENKTYVEKQLAFTYKVTVKIVE